MAESGETRAGTFWRRALAYGVHVFTALGAALGLLAFQAVSEGQLALAFAWLGAALAVDALDGPLARLIQVKRFAARYDGAQLDLVVDFVTYVFVPAAMLLRPEVMDAPWGLAAGILVTLTSALYFADTGMKTDDWWFRGFPAVWNIVLLYIVVFAPPAWLSFAIVVLAATLMFLPVVFVHPVRVRRWRGLTLGVLGLWGIAALTALAQGLRPGVAIKTALLAVAVYFVGLGLSRAGRARGADR